MTYLQERTVPGDRARVRFVLLANTALIPTKPPGTCYPTSIIPFLENRAQCMLYSKILRYFISNLTISRDDNVIT